MRAKSNVNISRQLCSDWLKMWYSPWIFFVILHQNVMRFCLCFHISWGSTTDFTTKEQSLAPLVERAILTITSSIISFIIRYIVWLRRRLLHDFPLSKVSWEYVYLHCNICFEKKIVWKTKHIILDSFLLEVCIGA